VKGLVELHGGRVAAASEGAGHGSEFSIHLPLVQTQATLPIGAMSAGTTVRSFRILVIEDNPLAARSMRMLLEHVGHTLEVAQQRPNQTTRQTSVRLWHTVFPAISTMVQPCSIIAHGRL
jgi:hypothetical protein